MFQATARDTQDIPVLPSILVVDDVPANIVALEAALEALPCRIVSAGSGSEALGKLLEQEFAVVFLDVQMPGMDGYETAQWIRSRTRTKHTPIIFVTAHDAGHDSIIDAYKLGAVDFLFKPLHTDVLRAKARTFVELASVQFRERQQLTADARRAEPRSAPVARTAERPLRILLVEDDEDIRLLTADLLTLRGHTIDTASDGPSALERLCTTEPDVALIDIGIPGFDGFELAAKFRESRPQSRTQLVAVTGFAHKAAHERAQTEGFMDHLVKPVNLAALERALAKV